MKPLYIADGNVKWYSHEGKECVSFTEARCRVTEWMYEPAAPFPEGNPKNWKLSCKQALTHQCLIATLQSPKSENSQESISSRNEKQNVMHRNKMQCYLLKQE